ncbi:hypothetical protein DFH28DRAFT_314319 [Melampsora americana]|nr:hypothetical protein DFH28DRAFT_314319 [Melampsora americana]
MVITRRAAAANLANQNHELTNKTHHQSIKPKQKDKRSHSTSSSSTHPTLIGKSKSNRKKTKVVHHHPSSDPTHPSDSIQNPNQDKENKEKKSVFGFKFDSSSIPVSNFNPTLCYDFSTSFVPSKGNSLNSIQSNSLLNPTSSVHQTHQNLKSTNTSSIKPNLENDEFQTMKSAINTITQFLATSNEDPNHILSIFEGIMADPVMRARVPTRLLQDYEMALTQRPGCSKEMILIDGLVAATGTATRLAKDLMRRKQQIRQSFQESTHHPASYPSVHPSTHPITSALSLNRGDPLTEYNLSQCESSMIPGNPMNPKPLSFQPILNQPILQLDPPIQLRQSTSNLESGFEVQSVTPSHCY